MASSTAAVAMRANEQGYPQWNDAAGEGELHAHDGHRPSGVSHKQERERPYSGAFFKLLQAATEVGACRRHSPG